MSVSHHGHGHHHTTHPSHEGAVRDPVCGMSVEPATAKHRAKLGGSTYYFCCAKCRERFVVEPNK